MAGHLDSTNVFRVRLESLGVDPAQITALESSGVDTLAKLAYLSSVQPGTADDTPFLRELAAALQLPNGVQDLTAGMKSIFRRIWFEASTVAISEIRNKVEHRDEDAPRHMPQAERVARLKDQQAKLAGICIEGSLEPSNSLLDAVWAIKEENQLRIVTPEQCTSRSQEVLGIKKESFLKSDASGVVTQVSREVAPLADMSTEYRIKLALTRRALAFDLVGLIPFRYLESYHDYLYSLVMKEPLDTHYPITVPQILKADKQLWMRLVELTREGISISNAGITPLQKFLPEARLDPLFNALLQPLPKPAAGQYAKQVKPFADATSAPYQDQSSKGNWKGGRGKGKGGKGKGKGGKSKPSSNVPDELKGLRSSTSTGRPYCWAHNLPEGCTASKPGSFCPKGFHGCMKCGDLMHSYQQCPKR